MAILLNQSDEKAIRYIIWHWKNLGCPPSVRNIGEAIGLSSPASVWRILNYLEHRGAITRDPTSRAIRVVNGAIPELCEHDWRVEKQRKGILTVVCAACFHKTEKEHQPDPSKPNTWLKYVGS